MTTTNELMMAVNNIQPDAQAGLPVLPNNGNPQGANNMRSTQPAAAPEVAPQPNAVTPPVYFYPWLQPSPHMDAVKQMLAAPMYTGGQTYTTMPVPPPVIKQQPPTMGFNDGANVGPVMPITGGGLPAQPMAPEPRQDTNVSQFRPVLPRAMVR